jgi:hypothetical protein
MTAEDKELLRQLYKLKKRVGNFCGVRWDPEAHKYRASLRRNGGRVDLLGFFNSEVEAFKHYRVAMAARGPKILKFESPARIERLLTLAGRYPAPLRPDPIMSSTMCQYRNRNWQE